MQLIDDVIGSLRVFARESREGLRARDPIAAASGIAKGTVGLVGGFTGGAAAWVAYAWLPNEDGTKWRPQQLALQRIFMDLVPSAIQLISEVGCRYKNVNPSKPF